MKICVLNKRPYCFNDEKTGILKEGVSINYIALEKLDNGSVGFPVGKISVSSAIAGKLVDIPCICDFFFEPVLKNDKPYLKFSDLKILSTGFPVK